MFKKDLDVWALAINRLGHPTGRALVEHLWKSEWVRRKVKEHPVATKFVSEGAVALTSLLELGGDHPVVRLVNALSETIATENLELLTEYEKNPGDPELAKKVDAKVAAAVAKAEDADVVIVFGHVHRSKDCRYVAEYVTDATPAPRTGKDGKVFTNPTTARLYPTKMSEALRADTPLCGVCYRAVPTRTPDEPKEKAVMPGRNFMEHLMRYRKEDAPMFEIFWTEYLRRIEEPGGSDLARKFADAFNGRYDYEAFLFVATLPSRSKKGYEEWHHALDALLGKAPPPSGYKDVIGGFFSKELKETERMVMNFVAWIKKGNEARTVRIEEKRAENDRLDDEWEARKKARKRGKWVTRIVFLSLAVAASAVWFLTTTP